MTPEQEIKLLKELLYCTKRSCNNCGKVKCENFQRQRIDCCGLWVSYKDYITELENKIADIKANCDLAIEGRDVKIMELEKENAELKKWQKDTIKARGNDYMDWSRMKDQLQEEINLHLHAEDYIKSLEKENAEQKEKIEVLECDNYNANCNLNLITDQLTKAKEIIRTFLNMPMPNNEEVFADVGIFLTKAEQFLKGENIILEDAQAGNSPFDADEVFHKEMKAYPEEK